MIAAKSTSFTHSFYYTHTFITKIKITQFGNFTHYVKAVPTYHKKQIRNVGFSLKLKFNVISNFIKITNTIPIIIYIFRLVWLVCDSDQEMNASIAICTYCCFSGMFYL